MKIPCWYLLIQPGPHVRTELSSIAASHPHVCNTHQAVCLERGEFCCFPCSFWDLQDPRKLHPDPVACIFSIVTGPLWVYLRGLPVFQSSRWKVSTSLFYSWISWNLIEGSIDCFHRMHCWLLSPRPLASCSPLYSPYLAQWLTSRFFTQCVLNEWFSSYLLARMCDILGDDISQEP